MLVKGFRKRSSWPPQHQCVNRVHPFLVFETRVFLTYSVSGGVVLAPPLWAIVESSLSTASPPHCGVPASGVYGKRVVTLLVTPKLLESEWAITLGYGQRQSATCSWAHEARTPFPYLGGGGFLVSCVLQGGFSDSSGTASLSYSSRQCVTLGGPLFPFWEEGVFLFCTFQSGGF